MCDLFVGLCHVPRCRYNGLLFTFSGILGVVRIVSIKFKEMERECLFVCLIVCLI